MIGKNLEISQQQALFLMILHTSDSLSGSEIVQKLKDDLGEEWTPSPGATYKIIHGLEEKGLIQETTNEKDLRDQRLRTYSITDKGRELMPKVASRVIKVIGFLNTCCPDCCDEVKIVIKMDSRNKQKNQE